MDGAPPNRERESSRERRARLRQEAMQKKRSCKPFQGRSQNPKDDDNDPGTAGAVFSGPRGILPLKIVHDCIKYDEKKLEAEQQWQSYVEYLKKVGTFENALAVCDLSGPMEGERMEAAIALSLLIAALSKPPFHGICTIVAEPELHELNQMTLREKVKYLQGIGPGLNTYYFQSALNLILNKAISTKLPSNEMVKNIVIFSGKEIDQIGGDEYERDYVLIRNKFEESGFTLPNILFWNLCGESRLKPMMKQNITVISGFSGQMVESFLQHGAF